VTSDDPAALLLVQLGRLVRVLRQEAPGATVGPGGLAAMYTLGQHDDGLRLGELAEIEGISAPSLTRIVHALEERELVARAADPEDRRAQRVTLTAAGRTMIETGKYARLAALRRRFEALEPAQQRAIEDALPALEALAGRRS
jgi:DNA-binding MarR family transcriptional regulator